jgi:hypothetical protein
MRRNIHNESILSLRAITRTISYLPERSLRKGRAVVRWTGIGLLAFLFFVFLWIVAFPDMCRVLHRNIKRFQLH